MAGLFRRIASPKWLILPPVLIGIAVVAVLGMTRKQLNRVEVSERALPLTIIRATPEWTAPTITGYGTASPNRRWSAVPEVGGRLTDTHPNLRTGIRVQQGELLLQIDRTDFELRLSQRHSDLERAKAELRRLQLNEAADRKSLEIQQALLEVRRGDVQRLQDLRTRAAVSANEYELAQATFLQQQQTVQTLLNALSVYPASLDAAQAAIASSTAQVQEAERDLERTRIVAPFDGILTDVKLEIGQYVTKGQALFDVIDTSWVEVEAQFSISQLEKLAAVAMRPHKGADYRLLDAAGQQAELDNPQNTLRPSDPPVLPPASESPPANSPELTPRSPPEVLLAGLDAQVIARSGQLEKQFSGHPLRFTSTLDEKTRTLGIVVRVDNPTPGQGLGGLGGQRLRAGTYCEVILSGTERIQAFRLPRTAIDEGAVFVLDDQDRLRRCPIESAFLTGDDMAVTGGLQAGDRVVVNPPAGAVEQQLVHPVEYGGEQSAATSQRGPARD